MINFTNNNQPIIIGIDHGYGNCKSRNFCFKSGVAAYDKEPTFKENMLVYNGKYYLVGEEYKEFLSDKTADMDYYILTLAAMLMVNKEAQQNKTRADRPAAIPYSRKIK